MEPMNHGALSPDNLRQKIKKCREAERAYGDMIDLLKQNGPVEDTAGEVFGLEVARLERRIVRLRTIREDMEGQLANLQAQNIR